MPVLWKDEWWEDLSLATGAKIIDALSGIQIKDIQEEHLGKIENLKVTKEDTYIDGIKDLTAHIKALTEEGTDESLLRASRLNTSTARYFVGAPSEQALYYRRLKVEDAINAASCALENGIVPGGGIALLNASEDLPTGTIGATILKEALQRPFKQILSNAGVKDAGRKGGDKELGFDSRTLELVNMFDAGIVDPTDVTINSVKNAIGVAATVLTVGTVITLPEE
jgi:chaperonin GroEL